MPSLQVNGITIEYQIDGVGDPLLLTMGLANQLTSWTEEFVAMLVGVGFQVIRYDNRDIGLSSQMEGKPPSLLRVFLNKVLRRPPASGYTLTDMANDGAALLEALDIKAAHVAGVSMGGMISQELAIHHKPMVRSLCSIMSNTGDGRKGGPETSLLPDLRRATSRPSDIEEELDESVRFYAKISGPHFDPVAHRERAKASIARAHFPEGAARQTAAILSSPDRTAGLAEVTVPTLVIHGLVDPLVRPSGGIATAQAVPGSRLLMFPDMGHDLPEPRWGEIVTAMRQNADRAIAG